MRVRGSGSDKAASKQLWLMRIARQRAMRPWTGWGEAEEVSIRDLAAAVVLASLTHSCPYSAVTAYAGRAPHMISSCLSECPHRSYIKPRSRAASRYRRQAVFGTRHRLGLPLVYLACLAIRPMEASAPCLDLLGLAGLRLSRRWLRFNCKSGMTVAISR